MLEVTATEFAKRFSRYRQAAQREPVAVTHHNRVTEVLMSKHDFDEYLRLKRRLTQPVLAEDFTDEMVAALETTRMDPRHTPLNALIDGE